MSPDADLHRFLLDLRWDDIPRPAQDRGRLLLLDLLGTAIAGTGTALHQSVLRYARRNLSGGRARVLFSDATLSPEGAALVGGMTIDAIDSHDGHRLTKGHVGCGLLPALLAALDDSGRRIAGTEFLTLLAAGYEIGSRAGIALHATVPDYHTSGAWSAVNCAAISGHVMGLGPEAFAHALGIAEYHGPRSQMMRVIAHPTMLKDGSGWGAMAGVSAAYLAAEGFTGAPAVTVLAPEVAPIWKSLGRDWEVMNQYVKGFPVCRWAQPAVQAALDLVESHAPSADEIDAVEVHSFAEAIALCRRVPETTEEAQYAIGWPLAAALVRRRIGVAEVSDGAFEDAALREMLGRIRYVEDAAMNARFPAERFAVLRLRLRSGAWIETGWTTAKGDPETAFGTAEMVDKFYRLGGDVCSRDRLDRIHGAVMGLDGGTGSFETLLSEMFAAPRQGRRAD
ncbi:MmgE/PrpD family protein [Tropicimonas sediminicola]|uniref:2-methylcitrate dehydratase PrpD n=1 Tax=Tropicimonas sediminicola TaxID=1031541 RepID=A0A239D5X8_9RHOB|nr:MmgE/PrpD family protein [Tropicimonas sediminicola]SNS27750.1 2-methylcitrate dehydratase PrpD [Tropicimonas sediminicola]